MKNKENEKNENKEEEKKDETKEEKETKKEEKEEKNGCKGSDGVKYVEIFSNLVGNLGGKIIDYFSIKKQEENNKKNIINIDINGILKENNQLNKKRFEEIEDMIKKISEENSKENQSIIDGTKECSDTKTNIIVNDSLQTEEGAGIKLKTDNIKQFSNPKKEQGIALYDTVGIENTNIERGLEKIKEKVEKEFIDNLEKPDKSLHSILYCINNGSSSHKLEKGEIDFILELNNLYDENDILNIVFTQSVYDKTE